MWSICELIENDFKGIGSVNTSDYGILETIPNEHVFVNKKYYLRFKHQTFVSKTKKLDEKGFCTMLETNERRAERFKTTLLEKKKILFVRYEQDDSNRTFYEEYKNKNIGKEYVDIVRFVKLMREKYPELEFKILFITHLGNSGEFGYDTDNGVLRVKNTEMDMTWVNCHKKINGICENNMEIIKRYL